jgi:hypothetical protein
VEVEAFRAFALQGSNFAIHLDGALCFGQGLHQRLIALQSFDRVRQKLHAILRPLSSTASGVLLIALILILLPVRTSRQPTLVDGGRELSQLVDSSGLFSSRNPGTTLGQLKLSHTDGLLSTVQAKRVPWNDWLNTSLGHALGVPTRLRLEHRI